MIEFQHITKRYGTFVALNDVSFTVTAGEVTALVGHNGSGKTTCLRLMVGLIAPDGGNVSLLGLTPQRQGLQVRRRVSYLSDAPFATPHLTGLEHLQFHADVYRQPQAIERARELAERYRLDHVLDQPIRSYSRGMLQRLALIRALMIDAAVLLLDEPFNALDPLALALLVEDLKRRAAQGRCVLVSSHLLNMLKDLAEKVLVLRRGQLVYSGPLASVDWSQQVPLWFDPCDEDGDENEEDSSVTYEDGSEMVNFLPFAYMMRGDP
ncbi:multidrug ABC transporter ATP-binding protein [Thermogemmatispora aurantia]|uniref:Multidrug ABC transporter ATP-binding protein n=1 Tax=Thermogemmatispora aurantia TaxID=2045279 RepID=A0A5J4KB74_9CHLR|nr:ABC transporter ATP-binding protein [Thermogemmatispora aurantia]GER83911.1 multidrug ABC transporter ATP-binding protein [Thermogemmatispora aurantia]